MRDLDRLSELRGQADDAEFRREFRAVKQANKARLASLIRECLGLVVDPAAMFDIQVKRIHEYKRQLLNLLYVITRYRRIRDGLDADPVPRVVVFAGKAAPSYAAAKEIIRLIHAVAEAVNHDPAIGDRLKVAFLPDYGVSNAEVIIPAADLSEQISTAGTEASGTGNMKLALNGALTIGTLDGATVEMRDEVGRENIFIFGLTADEVAATRAAGYRPADSCSTDGELREVLHMIGTGYFSPEHAERFRWIVESLTTGGDPFFLLADYRSYVDCQARVDALFRQPDEWTRRGVLNVAAMGRFSSDRAVLEYANTIWRVGSVNSAVDPERSTLRSHTASIQS